MSLKIVVGGHGLYRLSSYTVVRTFWNKFSMLETRARVVGQLLRAKQCFASETCLTGLILGLK